jgi:hypothetical protein
MTSLKEPVSGYDKLNDKDAVASLSSHSQVELTKIEDYERANQGRQGVFNKLRWLRQKEPLPGYDAMSPKQVVARLAKADLATIKRVRGYERKFSDRREVMEAVNSMHSKRRIPLVSRDS